MGSFIPEEYEEIPQSGDLDEIKALVALRDKLKLYLLSEAEEEKAAATAAAALRKANTLEEGKILKQLDKRLTELLIRRKRSLWSKFGKTIELPGGTIRYRLNAKALDTPRSVAAIITVLLATRNGKQHVRVKYELDRDSLTQASEAILRKLKPFGVWVGKHSTITIKSDSEEEPTSLDRRRFRQPRK